MKATHEYIGFNIARTALEAHVLNKESMNDGDHVEPRASLIDIDEYALVSGKIIGIFEIRSTRCALAIATKMPNGKSAPRHANQHVSD